MCYCFCSSLFADAPDGCQALQINFLTKQYIGVTKDNQHIKGWGIIKPEDIQVFTVLDFLLFLTTLGGKVNILCQKVYFPMKVVSLLLFWRKTLLFTEMIYIKLNTWTLKNLLKKGYQELPSHNKMRKMLVMLPRQNLLFAKETMSLCPSQKYQERQIWFTKSCHFNSMKSTMRDKERIEY